MGIKEIWKRKSDHAADEDVLQNAKTVENFDKARADTKTENPEAEDDREKEGAQTPSSDPAVLTGKVMEDLPGGFVKGYLALMLLVCILLIGASLSGEHRSKENAENRAGHMTGTAYTGETETKEAPETETSAEKDVDRPEEKTSMAAMPETEESFVDRFFGRESLNVAQRPIYVTGLSSSEKQKLSFRESSFTKAVSNFLGNERIDARTIEFSKRLAVSVEGEHKLVMNIIYPKSVPDEAVSAVKETFAASSSSFNGIAGNLQAVTSDSEASVVLRVTDVDGKVIYEEEYKNT